MVRRLAQAVAVLMIVFVLLAQPFAATRVFAQAPSTVDCSDPINAQDVHCVQNVGGAQITPEKIREAINAPTPNLANTTAYVFYTISTLMYGTFWVPDDATTPTSNAYPTSVADASQRHGAIGALSYLTAEMFRHKPASTSDYVADLWNHSTFAPQANAQGLGYYALTPILGTWRAFRNVAYYFLIVISLITGFLVLIRKRVGGNVAVTVQSALPRIVITLLLITFSYAIAGLIVDLMFLILNFIITIFDGSIFQSGAHFLQVFTSEGVTLRQLAYDTNIIEFTLRFVFGTKGGAWDTAGAISDMIWKTLTGFTGFNELNPNNGFLGDFFSNIIQVIFTIILGVALLIAMFKTFFALMMSYAGFVINVALAPIILLQNALPGNNSYMKWIRNLMAGLAPFVVVVFMVFMSLALTGSNTRPGIGYNSEQLQETGLTNGLRLPMLMAGDIDASAFIGILGMGFILLLPQAVDMSKKMFGADGGVFDKYKNDAVKALQSGWKGGEMLPGVKIPGAKSPVGTIGKAAGYAGMGAAAGGAFYGADKYAKNRKAGMGRLESIRGATSTGLKAAQWGAGAGAATGIKSTVEKRLDMFNKKYRKPVDNIDLAVQERLRKRDGEKAAEKATPNLSKPGSNEAA